MQVPAVIFTAPGEVKIREIPVADPGPGEVQIRTRFSAISGGTEGWVLHNRFTWRPSIYPCVPGYQRVGTVTAVGSGVDGWREGDTAVATMGCWDVEPLPLWGSHAALANSLQENLYRMPKGVETIDAAGAVVEQVGYNAAYRAQLSPGDWVVVFGDGLIGQHGAQAARSRGARTILVGHREHRLALGGEHCADYAICEDTETVARIRAITGSEHVTAIIDTVQKPECLEAYLPLLEKGVGQIVYAGFSPEESWASMTLLHQQELTTHYISGIARPRMAATLQLMASGAIRLSPLVTHQVSFKQASAMWRMIEDRSEPFLGIVFDWLEEG
ncbi:MAG: zinc-binding dehydrogenase [Candidatus Latescibacterota bacterium]|nr:zinc-binding dehydrogenase [Candidatus Latescibacterota bacterium]